MTTTHRTSASHVERTAQEARQPSIHRVVLSKIEQVNPTIRLLQLNIPNGRSVVASPLLLNPP